MADSASDFEMPEDSDEVPTGLKLSNQLIQALIAKGNIDRLTTNYRISLEKRLVSIEVINTEHGKQLRELKDGVSELKGMLQSPDAIKKGLLQSQAVDNLAAKNEGRIKVRNWLIVALATVSISTLLPMGLRHAVSIFKAGMATNTPVAAMPVVPVVPIADTVVIHLPDGSIVTGKVTSPAALATPTPAAPEVPKKSVKK